MKVLAEIRLRSEDGARIGALRRSDLDAFTGLAGRLAAGVVLVTGTERAAPRAAVGLATAAISRGGRAALLECDPLSPVLARALGLAERPGLHEYLRGEAETGEVVQPLVLAGPGAADATEPLVCVVAGDEAEDDAPLLASERFRQAVAGLRGSYDLVVIVGPPLERGFTRLREVAALADAVVACVGRSELRGASGRRLRRALRRLPGRFGGFVAVD